MAEFFGIKLPDIAKYIAAIEKDYERKFKALEKTTQKAAKLAADEAKRNCPVSGRAKEDERRTPGRGRRSIVGQSERRGSTVVGAVGTNLRYLIYPEFGTAAHFISAHNARQVLRFYSTGGKMKGEREAVFVSTKNKPFRVPGIIVGTPENPRRMWRAKFERGGESGIQSMPWLRPAMIKSKDAIIAMLRKAIE